MNAFSTLGCRIYQKTLYVASFFLNFKEPELHEGIGSVKDVPLILSKNNCIKPLIVTGPTVVKLGLLDGLLAALNEAKVPYCLYSEVCPNPTFDVIEEAVKLFQDENCDSLISFGGGSNIDAAKAVAARIANPHKSLAKLKGVLKVGGKTPLSIAIPTTAGTGSEATVASVVVNPKNKDKFAINDPKLIPDAAVLDNSLMVNLPPKTVAMTGMDALTHAVESYIGHSSTKKSKKYALDAIALIKENLFDFYSDQANEKAREGMQKASYLAGVSFTRAYVGYVHTLAHSLGGYYNVAHGYANAVLLPHVLLAYGKSAHKRLAEISDSLHLTDVNLSARSKAQAFIDWVESMNAKMGIPTQFENLIKPEDLDALAAHAAKEGNPLYPVPKELSKKQLKAILVEVSA